MAAGTFNSEILRIRLRRRGRQTGGIPRGCGFGRQEVVMKQGLTMSWPTPPARSRPTPPAFPQAELCRAFGLAAVAAELNLQIEMLEPEVAEAVGMGAAALFLAGYGPKGIHSRSRRPFEWDDTRNRVRRDVLRSRRLARRATETGATILSGDNFNSAR